MVYDSLAAVVFDLAESPATREFLGFGEADDERRWHAHGCVMTTARTRCSPRPGAWRTRGASSMNYGRIKSTMAAGALTLFGKLYDVERDLQPAHADERLWKWQLQAQPVAELLHDSLGRWKALTRYLDNGAVPLDKPRRKSDPTDRARPQQLVDCNA